MVGSRERGRACRVGRMGLSNYIIELRLLRGSKAFGRMTRSLASGPFFTVMEMFIRESGEMARRRVSGFTKLRTGQCKQISDLLDTKESGRMTNRAERAKKRGWMGPAMKGSSRMESKTAKAS